MVTSPNGLCFIETSGSMSLLALELRPNITYSNVLRTSRVNKPFFILQTPLPSDHFQKGDHADQESFVNSPVNSPTGSSQSVPSPNGTSEGMQSSEMKRLPEVKAVEVLFQVSRLISYSRENKSYALQGV
jgi:hypothetical protein